MFSFRLYSAKAVGPSSEWGFIDGKPAKNEPNQISQSRRCLEGTVGSHRDHSHELQSSPEAA